MLIRTRVVGVQRDVVHHVLHHSREQGVVFGRENFRGLNFLHQNLEIQLVAGLVTDFLVVYQSLALLFRNSEGFLVVVEGIFFAWDFGVKKQRVVLLQDYGVFAVGLAVRREPAVLNLGVRKPAYHVVNSYELFQTQRVELLGFFKAGFF